MKHSYCKWPVIVGIVIGSLFVLSLVWCLARCLCCGLECCCGCLSCCNACCPKPRGKRRDRGGYQQAPPTPYQYHQPQPMQPPTYMAGGAGGSYRGAPVATSATFDSPSKKYQNEDALPAMPSWQNAQSKRVESDEEVELEKMDHTASPTHTNSPMYQQESLTGQAQNNMNGRGYNTQESGVVGAAAPHAGPYNDYMSQQQQGYGQQQGHASSPYQNPSGNGTGFFNGAPRPASPYGQPARSPYEAPQNTYHSHDQGAPYLHSEHTRPLSPNQYRNPTAAPGEFLTAGRTSPLSFAPTSNEYYDRGLQQPQQPQHPAAMPEMPAMPASHDYYDPGLQQQQQQQQQSAYAQPKPYEYGAAPSPGIVSPMTPMALTPGRKPMQRDWREV